MNLDASESFEAGRIFKEIKELYSTGGLLLVLNLLCLFLCSTSLNNFSTANLQRGTFTDNT